MKKLFIWTFRLLGITAAMFAAFLGYLTLTDYRPVPIESVAFEGPTLPTTPKDTLSILTWNIGYAGLSAHEDFFFDGGEGVRAHRDTIISNLQAIQRVLAEAQNDFLFVQEIDLGSKRSYYLQQMDSLQKALPAYGASFALNYHSRFVPQPFLNPMGRVKAGLASFGKYTPSVSQRFALAPDADWPVGLFMLDRCFLSWHFPIGENKNLVLINVHLSAYDDGTVKQQQLDTLSAYLLALQNEGHEVVVGGDWNMFPTGYQPKLPESSHLTPKGAPADYPAMGWRWIHPGETTNRWLDIPYTAGKTTENILDYFLVSPGINVIDIERIDLRFRHSDHQPVRLRFSWSSPAIQ
jgi:endonuclease/exonuclease/phosphatase family metal-dependent hydrolase